MYKSLVVLGVCSLVFATGCKTEEKVTMETTKDKVSYSLGMDFAKGFLMRQKIDVNVAALAKGIDDVMNDVEPMLTEKEAQKIMTTFRQEQSRKMQEEMSKAAGKNKEEGTDFLAKNAKAKGVTVTASGLQYKVIKAGTGATPGMQDKVSCHYRGTLLDGKEFDSSYKRNQPATFPVGGVIKGWTEALQMMKVGAKWELVIPSELGYGERGAGGDIGPGAVLKFEIELLDIVK